MNNVNPDEMQQQQQGLNLGGGGEDKEGEGDANRETQQQQGLQQQQSEQGQWGNNWNQGYGDWGYQQPQQWAPDASQLINFITTGSWANDKAAEWQGNWEPMQQGCYIITKDKPEDEGYKVINNKEYVFPKEEKKQSKGMLTMNVDEEWEEIKAEGIMDSGAYDTITSKAMLGDVALRKTDKTGTSYFGPDGGGIKNIGEGDIIGKSDEGIPIALTAQVGDNIKKLLISIRRVAEAGNMVIFNADLKALKGLVKQIEKGEKLENNVIVGIRSGVKSKIHDNNGMYTYPITMKRKKKKRDDMDVGMLEGNKFGPLAEDSEEDLFP